MVPAADPGRAAPAVLDDLARVRLLVVSGKGGVGRTTVAACLGLACAARGRRVLVGTTGDDDRLAWMLGAARLQADAREVMDRLFIQRLDPQRCIVEYGAMLMPGERVSSLVLGNRTVRRLMRALPGLDDYAVLGKAWHEATRGGTYDLVILDGPASGHLRYVLGVPGAIVASTPQGPLSREARRIQDALRDPAVTRSVLVGLPEPWPLTELDELAAGLHEQIQVRAGAVVLNGLWPDAAPPASDEPALAPMFGALARAAERGAAQRRAIARWLSARTVDTPVLRLPWIFGGVEGPAGTRALVRAWDEAEAADAADGPGPDAGA